MASSREDKPRLSSLRSGSLRWMHRRKTQDALYGYLFVLPVIVGLLWFSLGPVVASLGMSFLDTSLLSASRFVGLANFRELLTADWRFWKALTNSVVYAVAAIPVSTALQLILASALNRRMKGVSVLRVLFYLPAVTPSVAIGMLWSFIYNPQFGLANLLVQAVGLPRQLWLASTKTALLSIIIMAIWGSLGPGLVMFLAGLQGISRAYYEAAEIDGAGAVAKFRHITLPLLSPITFLSVVIGLIGALQVFDSVYLTTRGGPRNATITMGLLIFEDAFMILRFGYAAALAWVLAILIFILTFIQFRLQRRWVHYGG